MSKIQMQAILSDATKAGVYHMPQVGKKELTAAARANDFATFRIDLAEAETKDVMLAAIGDGMDFPDWYGRNFDALADCLGDLSWKKKQGYLVILEHCDRIHGSAEHDFVATLQVFQQAAEEWRDAGVPFWCLVDMQADGIAWLPTGP